MPDGRVVKISVKPDGNDFSIRLSATPDADIVKWGLAVDAAPEEYFTGLMERVVDGPQQASWATNLTAAINLRGEILAERNGAPNETVGLHYGEHAVVETNAGGVNIVPAFEFFTMQTGMRWIGWEHPMRAPGVPMQWLMFP